MKYLIIQALTAILFLTGGVLAQTFTSALEGAQEVPPNYSAAVGAGSVILNGAETNITVTLYLSGLSGKQTTAKIYNSSGILFDLPNGNFSQNFAVTPAQTAELKTGSWFFKINSTNFPNGEIRGQISASSPFNAVPFPFSNGSLDTTFDADGIVTTEISGGNNVAQAVAVQTDGKIVVAGFNRNVLNNDDFAVARYNPNGLLDPSFDTDGIAVTPIGAGEEEALAVAVQPDGKILLAGLTFNGSNYDIAVVRYNSDGTLDSGFDGDGIAVTSIGSGTDLARSIALQTDGKIVVAGQTFNGANNDFVVLRYNSNGTLDAAFDGNSGTGNGIVTTAIGSGNDLGYSAAIQTDGKIVVAGYYFNSVTNNDAVVVRYDASGVLDTSFDNDGIAATAINAGTDEALALALQADGKIVIAGCINLGGGNDFLLVRYNSNGSFDANFGTNGVTVTPIGNAADIANGVAIQSDGKIVAAGFSNNGANNDFAVIRRNPDGTPDTGFDVDGRLTTPIGTSTDTANGLAIQADGKIIVVGRTVIGSTADFGIARYGYGTNAQTNDGFFSLNAVGELRFDNAFRFGTTVSAPFNSLLMPPIPANLNLLTTPRVIQTSAGFGGEILVKFKLPARIDAANFNAAQILHFENGVWTDRATNTPPRDFAARTVYARVSSLSVFAIVSPLAQTTETAAISGRILSATGKPASGAIVTLTNSQGQTRYAFSNPFGYYRFRDAALREVHILRIASKRYRFGAQILTFNDEIEDLNFIARQ